jgi:glutaredoxin
MTAAVPVRVVVYSKPGCHLCADACAAVARVAADMGVGWEQLDITGDESLMRQWSEYVPVIVVDGEVHEWFRVAEDRLRAALA